VTANFRVLYLFAIMEAGTGQIAHFNVTAPPASEGTAQQMARAFPWDRSPRYLLHDRDSIYGDVSRQTTRGIAIREVLTAPRSPGQSPYVERLIGFVRRECLDHLIAFNDSSL
jgi:hypothetical protein